MEEKREAHDPKHFEIIINGEPYTLADRTISFAQLVELAFPDQPQSDTRVYTITYRKSAQAPHEGSLVIGETVNVKNEGTIFNVTPTDKS